MLSWLFPAPLAVGLKAPDFTLPDQDGTPVTLSGLRGRHVILVFYPADETPICRRQLCEFRDMDQLATEKGVLVLGINPGSAESHCRFRLRHQLPFPLLVDANRRVASLYRANGLFVKRTVYLIGTGGVICYSSRGKPPAETVIELAGRNCS
ncbi:MAG: peroxiredoxin [Bryobacteraceae bacterium]